jgi:hypothetical protein
MDYIKENKKIIYGGMAYHILITNVSSDYIYTDLDFPDVEFYTTTFFEDIIALSDLLHEKTGKPVLSEEGIHHTTFKINVNYENYCDITFTPERLYESIPYKVVDGYYIALPNFLLIDVFRVYNYPLNNYFRLTKTYKRANLLLKYYPFDFKEHGKIADVNNKYLDSVLLILQELDSILITDVYAYNYYVKAVKTKKKLELNPPYFVIISTSYVRDVNHIYKELKKLYPAIETKEYYPLIDYIGKRLDFYIDEKDKRVMLVQVYDETNNCIPYKLLDDIKITTFQGTIYYMFLTRLKMLMDYNTIKKKTLLEKIKIKENMIHNLIECKKEFVKKHGKEIVFNSDSPFEEFVVQCIGENITVKRISNLKRQERKEARRALKYRYIPGEGSKQLMQLVMTDFTGTEIKKEENKTLKN